MTIEGISFWFYFLVFCCNKNNKHVFSTLFVSFLSYILCRGCDSQLGQENVSDHALLCDFESFRCTLGVMKLCNRCAETLCVGVSDANGSRILSFYILYTKYQRYNTDIINLDTEIYESNYSKMKFVKKSILT